MSVLIFLEVYYVLAENPDPYPPAIDSYLNHIASTIGADVTWQESSDTVYNNFANTGKEGWFLDPYIHLNQYVAR